MHCRLYELHHSCNHPKFYVRHGDRCINLDKGEFLCYIGEKKGMETKAVALNSKCEACDLTCCENEVFEEMGIGMENEEEKKKKKKEEDEDEDGEEEEDGQEFVMITENEQGERVENTYRVTEKREEKRRVSSALRGVIGRAWRMCRGVDQCESEK
jgi:hypothetical protein